MAQDRRVDNGLQPGPVVLDPVCVAGSGDPLLEGDALSALRELLLPIATVLTPNLAEGALLLERPALGETDAELVEAAQALIGLGPAAVLLKGGHRAGDADDVLVDADGELVLEAERIANNASHGTGCSLSSAVAAFTIVPRHVLGGTDHTPPSEKLNIACVGPGGRGAHGRIHARPRGRR